MLSFLLICALISFVIGGRSPSGELSSINQAKLHKTGRKCVTDGDCDRGNANNQCKLSYCDLTVGTCTFHRKNCTDSDPCTADYCTPKKGCVHKVLGNCKKICKGNTFNIITFDDIAVADCCYQNLQLLNPYQGIMWSSYWYVAKSSQLQIGGYLNAAESEPNFVFTGFAQPVLMDLQSVRQVWSVYATAAWNHDLNLLFEAYTSGVNTGQLSIILPYAVRTFCDLSSLGSMDTLKITPSGGFDAEDDGGAGAHATFDNFVVCDN